MKKIIVILLVAVFAISLCACKAKEDSSDSIEQYVAPDFSEKIDTGTLEFEEGHAETAVISKYSGLATTHDVVIPQVIAEREVSGIGKGAFYQLSAVKSVDIPDTVTFIGEFAFSGCTALETIVIPASVTYIDAYAFQGCTALKTVIFEGNVLESIGDFAFLGCTSLETIVLPEGLKSIGDWTFGKCAKITSIKTPSTLEEIGTLTFFGCDGLDALGALELSASITEIGEYAFAGINKHFITVPAGSYAAQYVADMAEEQESESDEDSDSEQESENNE